MNGQQNTKRHRTCYHPVFHIPVGRIKKYRDFGGSDVLEKYPLTFVVLSGPWLVATSLFGNVVVLIKIWNVHPNPNNSAFATASFQR